VAVVTGASGPIGEAVVEGYAQAGADVVMIYSRDDKAVQRAPELAKANGVRVEAVQLDGQSIQCRSQIETPPPP
jgi:short-subunit dehydrogenase